MRKFLFKLLFPSLALEFWQQEQAIKAYKEMVDLYTKNESLYQAAIDTANEKYESLKAKIDGKNP